MHHGHTQHERCGKGIGGAVCVTPRQLWAPPELSCVLHLGRRGQPRWGLCMWVAGGSRNTPGAGLLGSAGPQTSCCLPEPQSPPLQHGDVVEMLGWVHAQPLPRASVPLQGFSRTVILSSQGSEAGKTGQQRSGLGQSPCVVCIIWQS